MSPSRSKYFYLWETLMEDKLKKHIQDLTNLNNHRKKWLMLSAFVVISVLGIVFEWKQIEKHQLIWLIASLGLVVSVTWWYWTMRLIRVLIGHRMEETELLLDLVKSIREVNEDLRKLHQGR